MFFFLSFLVLCVSWRMKYNDLGSRMNLYVSVVAPPMCWVSCTNGMEIVLARCRSWWRRGGRALFSPCFPLRWMDDCNQREKDFCPDYSLQSVSLGNDMYIILRMDSTASHALPVSTLPKTWWEIRRAIGLLPIQREGVSFHFSQWVFLTTVSIGTPSWPPSIQTLTPFDVHFHKTETIPDRRSLSFGEWLRVAISLWEGTAKIMLLEGLHGNMENNYIHEQHMLGKKTELKNHSIFMHLIWLLIDCDSH